MITAHKLSSTDVHLIQINVVYILYTAKMRKRKDKEKREEIWPSHTTKANLLINNYKEQSTIQRHYQKVWLHNDPPTDLWR